MGVNAMPQFFGTPATSAWNAVSSPASLALALSLSTPACVVTVYRGHVVFQDYAPGGGFTAGEAAATASLTLLIRTGRSPEYKRDLLKRIWEPVQNATSAPDDQIVLGIQEVPPSHAMEMGRIMPDVGDE
jgi:hypothetical protein